jgi:glucan phosphoethanolaminetransferase (alkaline phosphatase superfamily)
MEDVVEKTGFKAFLYGLGGFIGSNIIINICATIGGHLGEATGNLFLWLVLLLGSVAAGFYVAIQWRDSAVFRATKTGITVSLWLQACMFVLAFLAGLTA